MKSADVVDPGPQGGGAACVDDVPPELEGAIVCGWVGSGTLGQLTVRVDGMAVEDMVPILHLFREATTTGDAG
ncbi:hypothetical protein [Nocardioides zhouii]|uniref:Uncharacterized protein n=1 Tax=Nocardioides zhouii TaxID=1168729 RepID=A0A4Q2T939_9ACTN|nr:hypothetical protein [Nocardioides zhouii]RYC13710.1 hypothetical protein EUA94_03645 [Nocardioides zhouii]